MFHYYKKWIVIAGLLMFCFFNNIAPAPAQSAYTEDITYGDYDDLFIEASTPSPNGSVIVCGIISVPSAKGFIAKIDTSGTLRWSRQITGESYINFQSIVTLADGSIIIGGDSYQFEQPLSGAPILVCLSPNGEFRWGRRYKFEPAGSLNSMIPLSDGGFFLCGNVLDSIDGIGRNNFFIKTDSSGAAVWSSYGTALDKNTSTQYVAAIEDTVTHSLFVTGSVQRITDSLTPVGPSMLSIVQFQESGVLLRQYLISLKEDITPVSIVSNGSSGFVIGATVTNEFSEHAPALFGFNASAECSWATNYSLFSDDELRQLHSIANGNLIGSTYENANGLPAHHLFMTDSDGTLLSAKELTGNLLFYLDGTPFPGSSGQYMIFQAQYGKYVYNKLEVSATTSRLDGCHLDDLLGTVSPIPFTETIAPAAIHELALSTSTYQISTVENNPPVTALCGLSVEKDNQVLKEPSIRTYPNPMHKGLSAKAVITADEGASYDVVLYDEIGRELYRTHTERASMPQRVQLPTANLNASTYMVAIFDSESRTMIATSKLSIN